MITQFSDFVCQAHVIINVFIDYLVSNKLRYPQKPSIEFHMIFRYLLKSSPKYPKQGIITNNNQ